LFGKQNKGILFSFFRRASVECFAKIRAKPLVVRCDLSTKRIISGRGTHGSSGDPSGKGA